MNSALLVALGENMEILETVPIYGVPNWIVIMICASFIMMVIVTAYLRDTKLIGPVLGILSLTMLISGIILVTVHGKTEFQRNEYIVRITDMPTREFIEKYEVTKHFEYSDVFQIKKIENK